MANFTTDSQDSSKEVRQFFDKYFRHQITFPTNQVDAVIGFFMKRGFEEQAAKSTAIILLNQARLDNVNVFQLLDTLKGYTEVQLSQIVTEIVNAYREKTSLLGYKIFEEKETLDSRNIRQ
jgi:hypothetical protein